MDALNNTLSSKIKNWISSIDWVVFGALLLMINVSTVVKLVGIVFLLFFSLRNGFKVQDLIKSETPKFYLIVLFISLLHYLLSWNYFDMTVIVKTGVSLLYWGASFLILTMLYKRVKTSSLEKIKNAITLLLVLNIAFSFIDLLAIIIEIKDINPFTYKGSGTKYFMSTGDYIRGVSFDTSSVNAFICLFSFIYFLFDRKYLLAFLSVVILLFTNSNLANLILLPILILLFIQGSKFIKTITVLCFGVILIFYIKIIPQSFAYIMNHFDSEYSVKQYYIKENDSIQTAQNIHIRDSIITDYHHRFLAGNDLVKETPKEIVKNNSIKVPEKQKEQLVQEEQVVETTPKEKDIDFLKEFIVAHYDVENFQDDSILVSEKHPGKVLSHQQTLLFSMTSVEHFLIGNGPGNFSSKLAFKLSGVLNHPASTSNRFKIDDSFKKNHLRIYSYYFNEDVAKHSILNAPYSSYNQLLGEYGYLGLFAFIFFYLGFFIKRMKLLQYGRYLLIALIPMLFIDYLFEGMSILILFELLMFVDIKSNTLIRKKISNE